jgi:hypothetical protein
MLVDGRFNRFTFDTVEEAAQAHDDLVAIKTLGEATTKFPFDYSAVGDRFCALPF